MDMDCRNRMAESTVVLHRRFQDLIRPAEPVYQAAAQAGILNKDTGLIECFARRPVNLST